MKRPGSTSRHRLPIQPPQPGQQNLPALAAGDSRSKVARPSDPHGNGDRSHSHVAGQAIDTATPQVGAHPDSTIRHTAAVERPASDSSSQRMAANIDHAELETQPTIITKSQSLAQYPLAGMHPREMGRVLEGQRLGHFELMEYVGGGGMGAVFKALDTMLNRIVAVKVLSQEQSSDEETLRRFQNEAQSAARLDHENISRVYYVGEDRSWYYIVFEFIEGSNLRDVVDRQGPLPLAETISYTWQIADALSHASQRDVVHRDIKPSNVLITPEGRAKLVDMGLARLHQVHSADNDLTASGVTLGTFDYISPEQARDPRSADVRSDIYSLGCTVYFMLTGQPPFPDGTVLQKLLQHQGDEPPDPRLVRPELPDELVKILQRMLAKSPDLRYAAPEELIGELNSFALRHGLQTSNSGNLVWVSPPKPLTFWERHLPWIAPVAVLLVAVGLIQFAWPGESETSRPPPLEKISDQPADAKVQTPESRPNGATGKAPPQLPPSTATQPVGEQAAGGKSNDGKAVDTSPDAEPAKAGTETSQMGNATQGGKPGLATDPMPTTQWDSGD